MTLSELKARNKHLETKKVMHLVKEEKEEVEKPAPVKEPKNKKSKRVYMVQEEIKTEPEPEKLEVVSEEEIPLEEPIEEIPEEPIDETSDF